MDTPPNESNEPQPPSGNLGDNLAAGMRQGADDARKATETALPKLKFAAARAAYWASYGVSYAATFEWTLIRHGAREGARAAKEAAEKWIEKVKAPKPTESPDTVHLIGPSPGDCQPGLA